MNEITTAGDLDELPAGSVLGYVGGAAHRQYAASAKPMWRATDGGNYWSATALAHTFGRLTVLYRPDRPKMTDAALVEEAGRRGMSVMDEVEAARLRGVAEGVEEMADAWDQAGRDAEADGDLVEADFWFKRAAALRALLHVDIESEA